MQVYHCIQQIKSILIPSGQFFWTIATQEYKSVALVMPVDKHLRPAQSSAPRVSGISAG